MATPEEKLAFILKHERAHAEAYGWHDYNRNVDAAVNAYLDEVDTAPVPPRKKAKALRHR